MNVPRQQRIHVFVVSLKSAPMLYKRMCDSRKNSVPQMCMLCVEFQQNVYVCGIHRLMTALARTFVFGVLSCLREVGTRAARRLDLSRIGKYWMPLFVRDRTLLGSSSPVVDMKMRPGYVESVLCGSSRISRLQPTALASGYEHPTREACVATEW